ncbi:hypothetical protein QOT17_018557 [Balamuthia mandrillaris]
MKKRAEADLCAASSSSCSCSCASCSCVSCFQREGELEGLPPEVLQNVFAFLPSQDLHAAAHVCHEWSLLARDPYLHKLRRNVVHSISRTERLRVAVGFLASAPPFQYFPVAADLKQLVPADVLCEAVGHTIEEHDVRSMKHLSYKLYAGLDSKGLVDAKEERAEKEETEEQEEKEKEKEKEKVDPKATETDTDKGTEVKAILCKASRKGHGIYLDPRHNRLVHYNHVTEQVLRVQSLDDSKLNEAHSIAEMYRENLETAIGIYVAMFYSTQSCVGAVYIVNVTPEQTKKAITKQHADFTLVPYLLQVCISSFQHKPVPASISSESVSSPESSSASSLSSSSSPSNPSPAPIEPESGSWCSTWTCPMPWLCPSEETEAAEAGHCLTLDWQLEVRWWTACCNSNIHMNVNHNAKLPLHCKASPTEFALAVTMAIEKAESEYVKRLHDTIDGPLQTVCRALRRYPYAPGRRRWDWGAVATRYRSFYRG